MEAQTIKATLKNNKTGETVTVAYTPRQLLDNFFGESDLMQNIIENNICRCQAVGETNVVEDCYCYEQWEDYMLILGNETFEESK